MDLVVATPTLAANISAGHFRSHIASECFSERERRLCFLGTYESLKSRRRVPLWTYLLAARRNAAGWERLLMRSVGASSAALVGGASRSGISFISCLWALWSLSSGSIWLPQESNEPLVGSSACRCRRLETSLESSRTQKGCLVQPHTWPVSRHSWAERNVTLPLGLVV